MRLLIIAAALLPAIMLPVAPATAAQRSMTFPAASATPAPNPIQIENAKPGSAGWDLPGGTATRSPTASTSIQGYASQISVQPGDTLQLHVSTNPAAPYRVEIYRLGWYQGLGGRLIACLPSCAAGEPGSSQPVPAPDPQTGELDAGWPVTDTIAVGPDWVSGYFVAKLVLTGGPASGQASWVPFIVRAAPGTPSTVLVQASVNTWEAYNNWGGKSLYTFNSSGQPVPASQTTAAAVVSFQRPFGHDQNAGPFAWEYALVRYLERQGYDVSYQTDIDTDQNPTSLLGHHLDIASGHDEYWSPGMRDAWEAARAAGVNLAFIGGNQGVWQARYGAGDQTLIEYRSAKLDPDPVAAQKTVAFAQAPVNRPECELLGIGYPGGALTPGSPHLSYTVTASAPSTGWLAATNLVAGSTIYDSVGYEWDSVQPGCPVPPLTTLLHFSGPKGRQNADAVTYTATSGSRVFSDGSLQLAWALDDFGRSPHADPRVQQLFANIFTALGASLPPGGPSGLPVLLAPAGGLVGLTVTLRWSDPISGPHTYTVLVDGRAGKLISGPRCSAGICSAIVKLRPGKRVVQLLGVDGLGNRVLSKPVALTVDGVPPSQFALRTPRQGVRVCTRRHRFSWSRSRDRLAGIAYYLLLIDGRPVARTRRTSVTIRRKLRAGRHTWTVVAVDGVGNRRRARGRVLFSC